MLYLTLKFDKLLIMNLLYSDLEDNDLMKLEKIIEIQEDLTQKLQKNNDKGEHDVKYADKVLNTLYVEVCMKSYYLTKDLVNRTLNLISILLKTEFTLPPKTQSHINDTRKVIHLKLESFSIEDS